MAVVEIRPAGPEEAAALSAIYAASWKRAYAGIVPQTYLDRLREDHWVPYFTGEESSGRQSVAVLTVDGRAAGAASFGPAREEAFSGWGEVISIYLHPDFYGRGYGAPLLGYACRSLYDAGFRRAYLWVLEKNRSARRFYEKHGFVFQGDRLEIEMDGQRLTELRYACMLPGKSDCPAGREEKEAAKYDL